MPLTVNTSRMGIKYPFTNRTESALSDIYRISTDKEHIYSKVIQIIRIVRNICSLDSYGIEK